MYIKNLGEALRKLGIEYDDELLGKFRAYMEGVLEWNEKVNLTAITDRDEFINKHYIDSLACAGQSEILNAQRIIDVGTGGGFPGIPLALIYPEKEFVLMDSLNKRLKIIAELCGEIGIGNVTVLHGRAEELAQKADYRESFDLCVSRAVANLATLSEYCLPFVKPGGYFMAYKGPECEAELSEGKKAINVLGGTVTEIRAAGLEEFSHNIICIKKIRSTPAKYPRKAGTPSKQPIR